MHIKQQRRKQKGTKLSPKQGPTITCMKTWIPRRTEESIEDGERKGKELERHLSGKGDQR